MALPTIIAEVGFGSDATAASPTWTDISARVTELSVKRGRNTERDATETGVLTMTARNYDRALDPAFASSPYSPNVVPIVPVRLRATFSAVTYNLYRGDVEEWLQKWTARENLVSIPC